MTRDEIARKLNLGKDTIAEVVDDFLDLGLMMCDEALVLSLALPGSLGR